MSQSSTILISLPKLHLRLRRARFLIARSIGEVQFHTTAALPNGLGHTGHLVRARCPLVQRHAHLEPMENGAIHRGRWPVVGIVMVVPSRVGFHAREVVSALRASFLSALMHIPIPSPRLRTVMGFLAWTHLALDIIHNPIRPTATLLAGRADPDQVVQEVIPMPVLPRIRAVNGRCQLRVHCLRHHAVRRRFRVQITTVRAAAERAVPDVHAAEVAREGAAGEGAAGPALAAVAAT